MTMTMTASSPARPQESLRAVHLALLAASLALVLLPLGGAAAWVYTKHRAVQQRLEDMRPRYARLLGVQQQQEQIRAALQGLQATQAEHIYPAEVDSTQTGNALQQRLRDVLGQAGLSVLSSQVRGAPPAAAQGGAPQPAAYERIEILIAVDGQWDDIQQALLAVGEIRPSVWLDDMRLNLMGNLQNQRPEQPTRLQAQWVFYILRRTAS